MKELKKLVKDKTGVDPDCQVLIYNGKQLEDDNTLAEYPPLGNQSSIMLVSRLRGGSMLEKLTTDVELLKIDFEPKRTIDNSLPACKDECLINLRDFHTDGVMVWKMPCGHPVSSHGLMDYCWNEINRERKTEFKCPVCKCEWSLAVIKQYGGISTEELGLLETALSRNYCNKSSDIKQCLKCQTYCTRKNPKDRYVECIACKKHGRPEYHFCWCCLKEWKNSPSSTSCGNSSCKDVESLALLRDCGRVKVAYIKDCTIFKYRACVHCGTLIELSDGCKHMQCTACKTEFCFICLRRKTCEGWLCGSYKTECKEAPIQTVIPHNK